MKRFVLILLGIIVLAAAVLGGYFLLQDRAVSQASSVAGTYRQIVTASRGNLSSSISVVGELDSAQRADLAFEKLTETTELLTLKVAAGNTVKAGDVIATVDATSYQQAVDQAQSDLQAAEQTLADLQEKATAVEIAQADLAIAQAEYQAQEAQSALADLQEPDLDALRQALADAQTALVKAQAALLGAQESAKDTTSIEKLQDTEDTLTETYNRLAAEKYSDDKHQDRLVIAYDKMMDGREARVTAQLQVESSVLNAQISVRKAEQALTDAQQALADAQAGGDQLELANAELSVKAAEVALAAAQDARAALDEGADVAELAAAESDVAKKKLALADAEAALAATTLTAPFDGTVLETTVSAGDRISAGAVIATIADLNQLFVLASVDETTVRSVSAGQAAQVTFDALPGLTLSGSVGDVPLQGALQGDVMVYEVPIALESAEQLGARVGMTANVAIATGEAADALLVPTMALSKSNGMYQVTVADPGNPDAEPQTVPVQIGLSDGTHTQITAGLNEGDQVLVTMSDTTGVTNSRGNSGQGSMLRMFGVR
jgi:multidrug efflux pump subunit AcrA (membrane-fusion protein)